ncbi:MAG: PAS domain-containing protein [Chloroflexota bacterium]|nr:PAS domain-containing protein [Chloroflexota bacterium]
MNDTNWSIIPSDWKSFELLQSVIDTFPDPIFVKDLQHRWIACDGAFCVLLGQSHEAVIGHSDPDFWPLEQAEVFWRMDDEVIASGRLNENEELLTSAEGVLRTIWTCKYPLRNDQGTPIGSCGIITDISEIKRRQDEVGRLEAEITSQIEIIQA